MSSVQSHEVRSNSNEITVGYLYNFCASVVEHSVCSWVSDYLSPLVVCTVPSSTIDTSQLG